MLSALPLTLLSLLSAARLSPGPSRSLVGLSSAHAGLLLLLQNVGVSQAVSLDKRAILQTSSNGSTFIWTIEDTYEGDTFFECVWQHCVKWRRLMGAPTAPSTSSLEMIPQSASCFALSFFPCPHHLAMYQWKSQVGIRRNFQVASCLIMSCSTTATPIERPRLPKTSPM